MESKTVPDQINFLAKDNFIDNFLKSNVLFGIYLTYFVFKIIKRIFDYKYPSIEKSRYLNVYSLTLKSFIKSILSISYLTYIHKYVDIQPRINLYLFKIWPKPFLIFELIILVLVLIGHPYLSSFTNASNEFNARLKKFLIHLDSLDKRIGRKKYGVRLDNFRTAYREFSIKIDSFNKEGQVVLIQDGTFLKKVSELSKSLDKLENDIVKLEEIIELAESGRIHFGRR